MTDKPRQPIDIRAIVRKRMEDLGVTRYALCRRLGDRITSMSQVYEFLNGTRNLDVDLIGHILSELDLDIRPTRRTPPDRS